VVMNFNDVYQPVRKKNRATGKDQGRSSAKG